MGFSATALFGAMVLIFTAVAHAQIGGNGSNEPSLASCVSLLKSDSVVPENCLTDDKDGGKLQLSVLGDEVIRLKAGKTTIFGKDNSVVVTGVTCQPTIGYKRDEYLAKLIGQLGACIDTKNEGPSFKGPGYSSANVRKYLSQHELKACAIDPALSNAVMAFGKPNGGASVGAKQPAVR